MAGKAPEAYRSISEAAAQSNLPAHVLRFWESKFAQLKPMKRAGGRRLYRPQDVQLLKGLRRLLYEEGFTIKGAQKYLRDHGVAQVCALGEGEGDLLEPTPAAASLSPSHEAAAAADADAPPLFAHAGAQPPSARGADTTLTDAQRARVQSVLSEAQTAADKLDAVLDEWRSIRR